MNMKKKEDRPADHRNQQPLASQKKWHRPPGINRICTSHQA